MPNLSDLYRRRCVRDVIYVAEQVPARVAARSPIALDDSSLTLVLFWTLLRWESAFWMDCLEELGVDMWALTRELDALIDETKAAELADSHSEHVHQPWSPWFRQHIDRFLDRLLDRAQQEASALGHTYLGNEHLLLTILANADAPLASLLTRHGIHYQHVKDAIVAALPDLAPVEVVEPAADALPRKPWGAAWDSHAAGVPRRFSLAAMLLIVPLYSVLFATLQSVGANATVFAVVAVFVTGVGLGQTFLFGGQYPRAASLWTGACLLPAEVLVFLFSNYMLSSTNASLVMLLAAALGLTILCVPAGAAFGYLSGGVAAGLFFLIDRYAERSKRENDNTSKEPAEEWLTSGEKNQDPPDSEPPNQ